MTKIQIKQISQLESIAVLFQARQLAYATDRSQGDSDVPPDLPDLK